MIRTLLFLRAWNLERIAVREWLDFWLHPDRHHPNDQETVVKLFRRAKEAWLDFRKGNVVNL